MTIRTQAALYALYPDNNVGDISAGDLRDLVDTFFQPRTVYVQATLQASTIGANKPTAANIGATSYHSFAVADEYWPHVQLPFEIDPTQDILINIDWAALASEATKTVSWQIEYLLLGSSTKTIDTVEGTLTVVDAAVPATQYEDPRSVVTIPSSAINAGDHELRLKLTRIASSNDPTAIAVHHIWAAIATKPPGAT